MSESDTEKAERRERIFLERVAAHDEAVPGYSGMWTVLEEHLLTFGGVAVVPPGNPDPMIEVLRDQGKIQTPTSVVCVVGADNDCHANAVDLWRTGQAVAIGTGYALSDDLWREHSWVWEVDGRLVETTKVRDRYFGIRMEGDAARRFAEWIAPSNRGAS